MEPSIFARMQWKQKCHPKLVQCLGEVFMLSLWIKCLGEVFMISLWTIYTSYVNYLCYLQKKHRTTINLWLMSHAGHRKVWLTRVGRFDRCMPAGRARLHVPSCWAQTIGWLGLPVTIRSPRLPIYPKSSSWRMRLPPTLSHRAHHHRACCHCFPSWGGSSCNYWGGPS
jgi:hypothetical protein